MTDCMSLKNEMKLKNVAVWGFLIAGVLGLIGALRDVFAPGFFTVNSRNPSKTDIVMQFVMAATFLALAFFTNIRKNQAPSNGK